MAKLQNISELGEFSLIEKLVSDLPATHPEVFLGPGDDAAWIKRPREDLLVTTDMLIEDVHFRRDWMSPEDIGFKALSVNISDIAAMGGSPRYALVSLGLPKKTKVRDVEELYRGLQLAAEMEGIAIVGGDTNECGSWVINITLMGEKTEGRVLTRSGAKIGDDIYISGTLGESALGLHVLKKNEKREGFEKFIHRHFIPPSRVSVGKKLARTWGVHSAMDISDGLEGDLNHIMQASRVSAEIMINALPLSGQYVIQCQELKLNPFELALSGGEDYELLWTVSPRVKMPYKIDGIPLTKIGRVIGLEKGKSVLRIVDTFGKPVKSQAHSFKHF